MSMFICYLEPKKEEEEEEEGEPIDEFSDSGKFKITYKAYICNIWFNLVILNFFFNPKVCNSFYCRRPFPKGIAPWTPTLQDVCRLFPLEKMGKNTK